MKKILAFLLAITMIVTFIPSAFAVEGEETAYDGVKMVYDLHNLVNGLDYTNAKGTTFKSVLNYTATNGLFKYVRSSATIPATQAMNVVGNEVISGTSSSTSVTFAGARGSGYVRLWTNRYVCFEVVVPKNGIYTLATDYLIAAPTRAGTVNVYITPASKFYALSSLNETQISTNNVLGEKVGSYDCTKNPETNVVSADANWVSGGTRYNKSIDNIELSAGKYIITYQAIGKEGTVDTFTLSSGTNPELITNGGVGITYDIAKYLGEYNFGWAARPDYSTLDYNATNGFFSIVNSSEDKFISQAHNGVGVAGAAPKYIRLKKGNYISFELNVPVTGTYTLKADYTKGTSGGNTDVYLTDKKTFDAQSRFAIANLGNVGKKSYDCSGSNSFNVDWVNGTILEDLELSAGKYVLTIHAPAADGTVCRLYLLKDGPLGTLTTDMPGFIKVDNTTLAVGETANITESVVSSSDGTVKAQSDTNTVYTSSDDSVVTVSGTTIKAVGAGTADIKTTVGGVEAKRTITVIDKPAGQTVSFAADGVSSVYVNNEEKEYTDLSLLSLNRGDTVKVVADTSDTTKTFRGWVRGSADSGRLVSNSTEYEFVAMTHTMLTAVYSDDTTAGEDVVEYYGWNQQYITTLPATVTAPTAPALTGYEFAEWVLGQSDDNVARMVAQYTAETKEYTVTVPDSVSVSVEGGKYTYDAKVTCKADDAVYWYRDNKLVDYGTSYSFYLWDNTEIKTSATGKDSAKIMLDKSKSGEFMVEYDAGNEEIVEVGLIFGSSSDITIGNCSDKMNSQRNGAHGQFTASKGDNAVARGYLIYNDNGTYRVIYAD